MNLDERTIAEELRLLADQAQPVRPHACTAQAVTRAARRRLMSWSMTGLAAACLVGAGIAYPMTGGPGRLGGHAAAEVVELPDNTPQQAQLVRDCMPEKGGAGDFHVLAQYGDGEGSTAFVGSTAGFTFCTPVKKGSRREPAEFTYWGVKAPGDLTVDAYVVQTDWLDIGGEQRRFRVVAGRVAPGVRRVLIGWAPGQQADAHVANGFFVGRVPATHSPDPGGRVDAFGEPLPMTDTPPVTVTAYDEAGEVAGQVRNVRYRGTGSKHRD